MALFLKIVFSALIMRFFWLKFRKFLKFGEIRNCGEKGVFFRRKMFSSFRSLLYKNGKAGNMPVVAGRLVIFRHMVLNARKIIQKGRFFGLFLPTLFYSKISLSSGVGTKVSEAVSLGSHFCPARYFYDFLTFSEFPIVPMAQWVGQGFEAKGSMGSIPSSYLCIFLLY